MKTNSSLFRLSAVSLLVACVGSSVSCMTTYDTYGRPVQSVDPGLAIAGVAAAGIIGLAAANNNDNCAPRRVRTVQHTTFNQGFCDDGFGHGRFGGGYGHGGGFNNGFGGGGCGVPVW